MGLELFSAVFVGPSIIMPSEYWNRAKKSVVCERKLDTLMELTGYPLDLQQLLFTFLSLELTSKAFLIRCFDRLDLFFVVVVRIFFPLPLNSYVQQPLSLSSVLLVDFNKTSLEGALKRIYSRWSLPRINSAWLPTLYRRKQSSVLCSANAVMPWQQNQDC